MSALDRLTPEDQALLREIIGQVDGALLQTLERSDTPTDEQRHRVKLLLWDEFDRHVSGPTWEPSERGKQVDDLLGRFLLQFPLS